MAPIVKANFTGNERALELFISSVFAKAIEQAASRRPFTGGQHRTKGREENPKFLRGLGLAKSLF